KISFKKCHGTPRHYGAKATAGDSPRRLEDSRALNPAGSYSVCREATSASLQLGDLGREHPGFIFQMGHKDQAIALLHPALEPLSHTGCMAGVQTLGGFVKQKQPWRMQQRAGEAQPRAHPG